MSQMHTQYTILVLYKHTLPFIRIGSRFGQTLGNLRYLFPLHCYQRLIPVAKEILLRNIPRKQIKVRVYNYVDFN
jgi:hypothetical protein